MTWTKDELEVINDLSEVINSDNLERLWFNLKSSNISVTSRLKILLSFSSLNGNIYYNLRTSKRTGEIFITICNGNTNQFVDTIITRLFGYSWDLNVVEDQVKEFIHKAIGLPETAVKRIISRIALNQLEG